MFALLGRFEEFRRVVLYITIEDEEMEKLTHTAEYACLRAGAHAYIHERGGEMLQVLEGDIGGLQLLMVEIYQEFLQIALIGIESIGRITTLQLKVTIVAANDISIGILGFFHYSSYFCTKIIKTSEKMKIIIINGPNLNLLGVREPGIYGNESMESYLPKLRAMYPEVDIEYFQSNVEGLLIDKMQEVGFSYDGIILNAGAYTHTSIALLDCIRSLRTPVIEVHLSQVASREEFRHKSVIGPACKGTIAGFGLDSYRLAIESLRGK